MNSAAIQTQRRVLSAIPLRFSSTTRAISGESAQSSNSAGLSQVATIPSTSLAPRIMVSRGTGDARLTAQVRVGELRWQERSHR